MDGPSVSPALDDPGAPLSDTTRIRYCSMRSALSGIIKAAQYPLTLSAIMDAPPLHAVCIATQRHWLVVGIPLKPCRLIRWAAIPGAVAFLATVPIDGSAV